MNKKNVLLHQNIKNTSSTNLTNMATDNTAILLIHCPDKHGILAAVTDFININKGNILYLDQWVDKEDGLFFMRVEWDLKDFKIPTDKIREYFETLIANRFEMKHYLYFRNQKPKMAIMVSKMSHCLYDMLARVKSGEWNVEVPVIISNHPDMEEVAKNFGIDYKIFPITKENKLEQEKKEIELLDSLGVDVIVLARYMQVLSEDFINHYPNKIINIHHSSLPAFMGAKPYHQAHARGVKLIGATCHYVTADLDAGPIIEQDVVHITHKDTVDDLVRKGRDIEKIVLSRGVAKHLNHKILSFNNRTVVFD